MTAHKIPVAQVQRRKQDSEEFLNLCKVMQPANVACLQRVPVCRLTFDQMALGDRTVSEGRKRAEGEGSICPCGSGGLRPLQQQECQTTLVDTVSFASHPGSCAYDYIADRAMSHVTGCAAMHVVEIASVCDCCACVLPVCLCASWGVACGCCPRPAETLIWLKV